MLVPLIMQNLPTPVGVPIIIQQPQSITVFSGQSATFTVEATGTGLSYQWYQNGPPIAGATNNTYTILQALFPTMTGFQFRVVVTNTAGSATSNIAILTVLPVISFAGAGPIIGRFL